MSSVNTNAEIAWPENVQDTLFFTKSFVLSLSNSISGGTFTFNPSFTGITGPGLPIAIYSLDIAPNTWYDAYDANNNISPLPLNIRIADDGSNNMKLDFSINPLVPGYGSGATINITIKFALIALPKTTSITAPVTGKFVAYHTGVNYSKLNKSGEVNKSPSNTVTVAHNTGYIPTFRVWDHTGGYYGPATQFGFLGGGIMCDANNLYLSALSVDSGSWVWRTYLEA